MIVDFQAAREAKESAKRDACPGTYEDALKAFRTLLRVHGINRDQEIKALIEPVEFAIVSRIHKLAPSPAKAAADINRIVARQDRRWMRDLQRQRTG